MTQPLPHLQAATHPAPERDLPVNDPPPADGAQPPVQDPLDPHPDPTLQQEKPLIPPQVGPDTAEPAAPVDADWADDLNPEAHESAV